MERSLSGRAGAAALDSWTKSKTLDRVTAKTLTVRSPVPEHDADLVPVERGGNSDPSALGEECSRLR
jgi:hypothetical protein